jgi:protein-S-isoprenylcysteine O-methyltransferase Ste14/O-antigen ligase
MAILLLVAFEPGRSRTIGHEILTDLIGFALAAVGQAIHIATLGTAWIRRGGHNNRIYADRLLTSGWYAHCRNPIYVGNLLVIAGLLIMFNNFPVSAIALASVIFSYHAIIITEENYLTHYLGIEYQSYCQRVPRWWPIFRGLSTTACSTSINWRWVIAKSYTSAYSWIVMMVLILTYKAWLFRGLSSMPKKIGLAGVFSGCSLLFLLARWLKKHSNTLADGPAAVIPTPDTALSFPRLATRQGWRAPCEAGLGASLFVLPAMLALVPRGAAPLVAVAGLCAIGAIAADPPRDWGGLRVPAALFGLLLLWGGLSVLWAIEPERGLIKDMQLTGLFAAAIVLVTVACSIADARRLAVLAIAGTALGLAVALSDFATSGGLSGQVSTRPFAPSRLNQIAVWLAIMLLLLTAFLWGRGRRLLSIAAAFAIGATVFLLDGTTAKSALLLSLPVAALLYWRRRLAAQIAAALSVVAVLTSPLILPLLADDPLVLRDADTVKTSLAHRFYIWDFAGKRIAERPLLGWGLDSARAIPGGKELIRLNQERLPLHPHNAPLQVWLELGVPAAVLFALLLGWLWLCLGAIAWPPLFAAASGGSLAAVSTVLSAGWGIWQEWWLATLGLAAFAIVAMARAAAAPAVIQPAIRPLRRRLHACSR